MLSAGILSGSAGAAYAAGSASSLWAPGIPDSASLHSPVFASGTVHDAHGSPVSGADVALWAWPSEEVQAHLKVGDKVSLTQVAQTRSDAYGRFTLRLGRLADVSPMESASGNVDFEVAAAGQDGGTTRYSFTSGIGANLGSADAADHSRAASATGIEMSLGAAGASSGDAPKPEATAAATDKDYPCTPGSTYYRPAYETLIATNNLWALVGDAYDQRSGVVVKYTYSQSASSSLGVGYSVSGSSGSWSQSGEASRASSSWVSFPWLSAYQNAYFDTRFEYGEYRETCANSSGYYQTGGYEVRPIKWVGASRLRYPGTPSFGHCEPYWGGQGSLLGRNSSAAVNWSNGVDISGWLGSVSLKSQTGYSTSASITFDMQSASGWTWLCGRYDYATGSPGDIAAYSYDNG